MPKRMSLLTTYPCARDMIAGVNVTPFTDEHTPNAGNGLFHRMQVFKGRIMMYKRGSSQKSDCVCHREISNHSVTASAKFSWLHTARIKTLVVLPQSMDLISKSSMKLQIFKICII
jgi:hypothetical protein